MIFSQSKLLTASTVNSRKANSAMVNPMMKPLCVQLITFSKQSHSDLSNDNIFPKRSFPF